MQRGRATQEKVAIPSPTSLRRYLPLAFPPLLLLSLSLPVLSFRFLSDDFNFLLRAYNFRIEQLLPDPRSAFYRPISREIYFGILALLSKNNPVWGHLLNACLAAMCVTSVTLIARRLVTPRTGLLAGLLFASLGPLPLLVGWTSCSQDLLAMLFIAGAIALQLRGRTVAALASTAAALLSKESAIFFLPGLAALRHVISQDRRELRGDAIRYAALGALWVLVNPKLRSFVTHGVSTGTGGYVGLDNPSLWRNAAREIAAMLNLPLGTRSTQWPSELSLVAIAGVAILFLAFRVEASAGYPLRRAAVSHRRVLLLGGLFGVLPAILTAASAKHWFPYYACLPAIGSSLILAVGLERFGWSVARLAAVAFLILGIWSRGFEFGARLMPTERNLRSTSRNLERIESGLKRLHPSLPDSSRLYITIQTPVESTLQTHMFLLQAPRVWYANTTLLTDDPGRLHSGAGPEFLFWVSSTCDVNEIRLPSLKVRSAGSRPDYRDYQKAVRSFAYGLFAASKVDRAVAALQGMQEVDSLTWAFDRRLAATMLFAAGRSKEGNKLCAGLPRMGREAALYAVAAVLGPELPGIVLDEAAFRAFDVPDQDPEAYRFLMHYFSDHVLLRQAMRMAERLLALRPGDEQASAMIAAIQRVPSWEHVVVPVE
jgi:hypothetical protein